VFVWNCAALFWGALAGFDGTALGWGALAIFDGTALGWGALAGFDGTALGWGALIGFELNILGWGPRTWLGGTALARGPDCGGCIGWILTGPELVCTGLICFTIGVSGCSMSSMVWPVNRQNNYVHTNSNRTLFPATSAA
jgi:hypothetical protein